MKATIVFKTLPMLLVVVYALSRHFPAYRVKRQSARVDAPALAPSVVSGVVQKVLKDEQYVYALLGEPEGPVWVGLRGEAPEVGQRMTYRIERSVPAYESKRLEMAFEKMLFAAEAPAAAEATS